MKRFFMTGTDTDCGKTWATSALLAHFNQDTLRAIGIKPVASGCQEQDHQLISNDALHLQKYTDLTLDAINPWRYRLPVSPHIAAKWEQQPLNVQEIADYCLEFNHHSATHLFIEGAGGLLVPLTDTLFWTDFLMITQIPTILVVGIRTGCINHALLTQAVLEKYNLPFQGWIANILHPQVPALDDNLSTLQRHLCAPLLGKIGYKAGFQPELMADLL